MKDSKQTKISAFFIVVCAAFILPGACCQDSLSIPAVFKEYHQNSIKEKIFVHTDKSVYLAGEIIWFKLYSVDASEHKPLALSKVAYVEILDSGNRYVLQAKIALIDAEGTGSFYLPLSINSGSYKLCAYTNWMKNFDAEYFFEKNVTIINVQKKAASSAVKPGNRYDIQFFPEGGNMVVNIPCKMAFKGTDEFGRGAKFKGFLLDNKDTLLRFEPEHAGMGSFSFTPLNSHVYKALIQTASAKYELNMPAIYSNGYVMKLIDSAGKIRVLITADVAGEEVYLFAHTREILKVADSRLLKNGQADFFFDKAALGDGISHITIFNSQKVPVCERLYFKKPSKLLALNLSTDQPVYATRKKVSINIGAGNTDLKNDSAHLSMTVYRLDSLESPATPAINSYLLLTSDLRGFVEDPDYYLKDDKETNTALDYLMLTNGWRRFKWEEVLKNAKPFFYYVPEYNGPIVVAEVINTKTGLPAAGIESYLAVPGFPNFFNSSFSDDKGRIKFELKDLYGPAEVILQPNTLRDSIYRIDINDPFSNTFSQMRAPALELTQKVSSTLLERSISMQVQNVYSANNLKQYSSPPIDTSSFYLFPDTRYSLDNYTRFTTMEEVLREYVSLVDVKKREGKFHISVFDAGNGQLFKTNPLVLLDGVPVFDLNKFMLIDPLRINRLEVLNRKYFLGLSGFDGILSWTSYKKDMADYEMDPHAAVIDYKGLQLERQFYAPVYINEEQQKSHVPDFRNVLSWTPYIKLAAGGAEKINFYTSDIPGRYAVEVQGISEHGLFGNKVLTFEVKK